MPPTRSHPAHVLSTLVTTGIAWVRLVAFWVSVGLAFAYPLLFVAIDSAHLDYLTFFALVGVHATVLVIGHGYHPDHHSES